MTAGDRQAAGAVIVGGGAGRRFGSEVPKQFHRLEGKPIIAWAAEALLAVEDIGRLVFVLPPEGDEYLADWRAGLAPEVRARLIPTVLGGERRQDSVLAGLRALPEEIEIAAVHDGARPFPPVPAVREALRHVATALGEGGPPCGAILALPATDSIKRADEQGFIARSLDRATIWRAQTPQVFPRRSLVAALEAGASDAVTDEAQAMERAGARIRLVQGDERNLKITTPLDMEMARILTGHLTTR